MQFLNVTRWPLFAVFLGLGAAAMGFAFTTLNLFALTMANLGFIQMSGWEAVRHGALRQLAGLTGWGLVALAIWMAFKIFEGELLARYRGWVDRPRPPRGRSPGTGG